MKTRQIPAGRSRYIFVALWATLILSAICHYDAWWTIASMVVTGYLWTGMCLCGICGVSSWRLVVLWLPLLFTVKEK